MSWISMLAAQVFLEPGIQVVDFLAVRGYEFERQPTLGFHLFAIPFCVLVDRSAVCDVAGSFYFFGRLSAYHNTTYYTQVC
jgi:hypothetical protein